MLRRTFTDLPERAYETAVYERQAALTPDRSIRIYECSGVRCVQSHCPKVDYPVPSYAIWRRHVSQWDVTASREAGRSTGLLQGHASLLIAIEAGTAHASAGTA